MSEREKLKKAIKDVAMTITSMMIWLLCLFVFIAIVMFVVNAIAGCPANDVVWKITCFLTFASTISELLVNRENSLFITMTDRIKSILEDK